MTSKRLAKFNFLIISICWITKECISDEHHYGDYRHADHTANSFGMDIYGDIKRALYFDGSNKELHSFIAHTFDLRHPNPTYMFILPNEKHKHVIMKRTDFKTPTFPNITELNIRLSRLSTRRFLNQEESDIDPLTSGKPSSTFYSNDDNSIFENIQTERTFIDYMERLNEKAEHLLEYIRKRKNPQYKGSNISRIPLMLRSADLEWDKLGLYGWKGEIVPYRDLNEPTISEKIPGSDLTLIKADLRNSRKIGGYNASVPLQWHFLDDFDTEEKWDLPGKVSQAIAPDLADLSEMFSIMSNVLNHTITPKWPIANPRSAHKNNDVYIARANDPFGYSTKWEFKSNSTSSRNKRGIGELYSMLKCGTGCDPLLLKGYGCYCGFLGAGIPADGIDRCCQAHDRCYERTNCPRYLQYFVPYLWKCYNGRPLCAVDNGEWGRCATQLCRCDLYLSACTQRYRCPRRRLICRSNKFRMLQNYLRII